MGYRAATAISPFTLHCIHNVFYSKAILVITTCSKSFTEFDGNKVQPYPKKNNFNQKLATHLIPRKMKNLIVLAIFLMALSCSSQEQGWRLGMQVGVSANNSKLSGGMENANGR